MNYLFSVFKDACDASNVNLKRDCSPKNDERIMAFILMQNINI